MNYHRLAKVSPDQLIQINALLKAQHGGARTLTGDNLLRILQTSELWVAENSSNIIVAIGLAITVEALSHTMIRIHNLYTDLSDQSPLTDLLSDMVASIQRSNPHADIHIALPVEDSTLTTYLKAIGFTSTPKKEFRRTRRK